MNESTAAKTQREKQEEPVPTGAVVKIVITYDPNEEESKKITVSPSYFLVSKRECEQVEWVCEKAGQPGQPGPPFNVDFTGKFGSPFYESQFSDQVPFSGPVRRNVLPDENKNYEYTVRIGKTLLDPGGGVRG
jgi:hypothetical protein